MPERIDLSVDNYIIQNKRWRITKGQSKIDIPKKLATQITQDEKKKTQKTQHNMCLTPLCAGKHK